MIVIDSRPLKEVAVKKSFLQTFATRAAQELERKQAEEELLSVSEEIDLFSSSLKELQRLKSTHHGRLEDLLADYLTTGSEIFGLPIGIISEIEGASYRIRATQSEFEFLSVGKQYNLADTYCADVVKEERTVTFGPGHEKADPPATSPYQGQFRPNFYLGTPLFVEGKVDGTLSFASFKERKPFSDYELEIIELMAQNLAREMERRKAEAALRASEHELKEKTRHWKTPYSNSMKCKIS